MRLSALIGLPVRDAAGRTLGRLHEIRAVDGRISELVYGPAGLFERLTGRAQPTTLPWSRVKRIHAKTIELNQSLDP
jgi:sporulation protein YlmC with PRC-barrel domain